MKAFLVLFSLVTTLTSAQPAANRTYSPSSSSLTSVKLHKVYVEYQLSEFRTSPHDNFAYIPNLNAAFHVTEATLFKITYQGSLYNIGKQVYQYVQIMVNNYLIIGNKLLPNTVDRIKYGLGATLKEVDMNGGVYYCDTGRDPVMSITRVAYIYLPAGTYSFNVGTRSDFNTGSAWNGIVSYELIQFKNGNSQEVGGYELATFPK